MMCIYIRVTTTVTSFFTTCSIVRGDTLTHSNFDAPTTILTFWITGCYNNKVSHDPLTNDSRRNLTSMATTASITFRTSTLVRLHTVTSILTVRMTPCCIYSYHGNYSYHNSDVMYSPCSQCLPW